MLAISRPRVRRAQAIALFLGASVIASACSTAADGTLRGDSAASAARADAALSAPAPGSHAAAPGAANVPTADSSLITVYKTPTCGCCREWVDYVRANGFRASVTDLDDMSPVKATHRITSDVASCHTALIGGYVVEGHVPVEDIRRMLRERPDIIGIAAPGMPAGSPGMEVGIVEKYDVIAFAKDGSRTVFARH